MTWQTSKYQHTLSRCISSVNQPVSLLAQYLCISFTKTHCVEVSLLQMAVKWSWLSSTHRTEYREPSLSILTFWISLTLQPDSQPGRPELHICVDWHWEQTEIWLLSSLLGCSHLLLHSQVSLCVSVCVCTVTVSLKHLEVKLSKYCCSIHRCRS